jgi:hypothetical protein
MRLVVDSSVIVERDWAPSIGLAAVLAPVLVQPPEGVELPDEPIDPTVLGLVADFAERVTAS